MPLPGLNNQVEIRPNFRKKLKWKTYTTLILLFILGTGTLIGTYLVSTYTLEKRIGDLEASKEKLIKEIGNQPSNLARLAPPPDLDPALLQQYANKVPADRELPRFLLRLDQLAQKTGVRITNIGIDDEPILTFDSLKEYLTMLDELALNIQNNQKSEIKGENEQAPAEENRNNPNAESNTHLFLSPEEADRFEQIFLNNPSQFAKEFSLKKKQASTGNQTESDRQANLSQQGADAYPALKDYIPFGMIGLSLESDSNLQQVLQFLGELRKETRLVDVEEWSYYHDRDNPARTIFSLKLHIFYYIDNSGRIPKLPPLPLASPSAKESNNP